MVSFKKSFQNCYFLAIFLLVFDEELKIDVILDLE